MTVLMMDATVALSAARIRRIAMAASVMGREKGQVQAACEFIGAKSRREQETLTDRYAEIEQELSLCLCLDAFRNEAETEAARDAGNGLADGDVRIVARHAVQEHLAELEPVDGQSAQIVEGAVAFAEVVDGQQDAEFTQRGERAD